jgi:hypothetical protein
VETAGSGYEPDKILARLCFSTKYGAYVSARQVFVYDTALTLYEVSEMLDLSRVETEDFLG